MGIKFRCPNGHKLNVKSFLAGKRGICPHCGIGVDIPHANGAAPNSGKKEKATTAVPIAAVAANPAALAAPKPVPFASAVPLTVKPTPGPQLAAPVQAAASPAYAAPSPVRPQTAVPSQAIPVRAAPAMPLATPTAVPAAPADPIAEAPNNVWYVRPPSGGQFGPAKGDIMRKWLSDGRVSADSLVWREGWADWKAATLVFPSLARGASAAVSVAAPPASMPANPLSQPLNTAVATKGRPAPRAKNSNTMALLVVVLLAVVSVILLVVFFWVVLTGKLTGTKKNDSSQLRSMPAVVAHVLPDARLAGSPAGRGEA